MSKRRAVDFLDYAWLVGIIVLLVLAFMSWPVVVLLVAGAVLLCVRSGTDGRPPGMGG